MIFDPISGTQMQAARLVLGATMAAFLAAPLFRGKAQTVRVAITVIYITVILVFIAFSIR